MTGAAFTRPETVTFWMTVPKGRNGKPVPQVAEPPLELPVDANEPCDPDEFPGLRYRGADG